MTLEDYRNLYYVEPGYAAWDVAVSAIRTIFPCLPFYPYVVIGKMLAGDTHYFSPGVLFRMGIIQRHQ